MRLLVQACDFSTSKPIFILYSDLAAMAVDKDLEDLAFFLKSPSPNLKKAAVEIVQGLSGTDDGVRRLSSHASALLPPLLALLSESEEISKPAAEALVNLSQDVAVVDHLIQVRFRLPHIDSNGQFLVFRVLSLRSGHVCFVQIRQQLTMFYQLEFAICQGLGFT